MSTNIYPLWSSVVLLLVIAAIPATLWLVRRMPGIGSQRHGKLRVVESLSIGPRERLVVVHTGKEYLLMGTAGQQLTLIKELDGYEPNEVANESFAGALSRAFESGAAGARK
jgi:flagellar protein FliO/FliZ